jgi:predicted GIY-YIG superfamily endonuclease
MFTGKRAYLTRARMPPRCDYSQDSDTTSASTTDDDDAQCFRCGRQGHMISECYARTHADGSALPAALKKQKGSDTASRSAQHASHTQSGIYVLSDANQTKMYVGKSNNMRQRIQQHLKHEGTRFFASVGKHIEAVEEIPCRKAQAQANDLESLERNKTLELMYKHGIQNVRGWMFTTTVLTAGQEHDAFKQICEKYDLCRKCGRNSHFADKCFARTLANWAQ